MGYDLRALNRAHDALGVSGMVSGQSGASNRRTMPYDPVELVELPTEVLAVITEMRAATRASGDGGTKVTRAERRRVVKAALHLAYVLTRDGLD
jgi:hypothetical protein